jgi:hypothetical protein
MKRSIQLILILATAVAVSRSAHYGITDDTMGEYEGFWTAKSGAKGRLTAQIRPLANNQYDGFVLLFRTQSPVAAFSLRPAVSGPDGLSFSAVTATKESGGDLLAQSEAKCELKNGKLTGTFSGDLGEGSFDAAKIERKSPTLGAQPPKNAIVLFDGQSARGWDSNSWAIKNGVLEVGKGNIRSTNKLASFRLHVEFRTPYMPTETGQARGNSGVYLQGKYEVQVLDSFGLYPLQDNDCGGIYSVQKPSRNTTLPPMQWQTYDITFSEGARQDQPTITVVHNGITIIDQVKVPPAVVRSGTGGSEPNTGFLMLQDHGNSVQYRNIWAEPLSR